MLKPTLSDWHAQFVRQARWTQMTRNQLYRRANLLRAERVLDVGCGTGAITRELARRTKGQVIGLDIDPDMIAFARQQDDGAHYETGDALNLPYPDDHFDLVTCHFVLLWVSDPFQATREMARVVRREGWVLVCAEPDYGGRLDWPDLPIRAWQIEGLRRQGAEPLVGRQLRHILVAAGLNAEVGVIPSHWSAQSLAEHFEEEWKWLRYDVGGAVDGSTFARIKAQAQAAIDAGTRLVYVPIFDATGRK
jgi:SAM-dependent methyltransferase